MHTQTRKMAPWGLALCIVTVVSLTACGSSASNNTPTPGVEAVFTAAFGTFEAQQATALALTPPTAVPSPTLFPTLPPPPTLATFPAAIPTTGGGSTANGCNNAAYVADVTIPDGTVIKPGASFTKTWTLLNTGSCPWTTAYKIAYFSGDSMGGSAAAVPASVAPGGQANMSVSLTAPSTSGSYTGYWRMQNDLGQGFGGSVYVQISVSGTAGPTNTAGPSPTASATLSSADLTATASAAPTSGGAACHDLR